MYVRTPHTPILENVCFSRYFFFVEDTCSVQTKDFLCPIFQLSMGEVPVTDLPSIYNVRGYDGNLER